MMKIGINEVADLPGQRAGDRQPGGDLEITNISVVSKLKKRKEVGILNNKLTANEFKKQFKITSCDCAICKGYCQYKPGWFLPEQVEDLCAFIGKSLEEMLGNECVIDYWCGDEENILVLSPNIVGNDDIVAPFNPHGMCVFYCEGKCTIYPTRPFECQVSLHKTNTKRVGQEVHASIASLWGDAHFLDVFDVDIPQPSFSDKWNILDSISAQDVVTEYNVIRPQQDLSSVYALIERESLTVSGLDQFARFIINKYSEILPEGLRCEDFTITYDEGIHVQYQIMREGQSGYSLGVSYVDADLKNLTQFWATTLCQNIVKQYNKQQFQIVLDKDGGRIVDYPHTD